MNRPTQRRILIGMAITLVFGFATSAMAQGPPGSEGVTPSPVGATRANNSARAHVGVDQSNRLATVLRTGEGEHARPFKLNAAGGIDLTTGAVAFGGVASHLGLYRGGGFLNPATFAIFGTIEAANGDMLNFTAAFIFGPLGELDATFSFAGGTGRFVDVVGTASGPVTLDPDFTFLISVTGHLNY